MRWVAHRGNVDGPSPELENTPSYLESALAAGFDVECDIVFDRGRFWFGHDEPREEAAVEFLTRDGVWCRAKNVATFDALYHDPRIHCFFQALDDVALTSRGFLWTHSRCRVVTRRSICAVDEFDGDRVDSVRQGAGICSNRIAVWQKVVGEVLACGR